MKLKAILAAIAVASCFSVFADASFERSKTYTEGQFTDVPASEWYAQSVKDAYELGIMNGDSAVTFNPGGTLTVAEGITIASRIHATLNGKTIAPCDGEWYMQYVNYAAESGFLSEDMFDNYDRNITRAEIAVLLADSCGNLPEINDVDFVPDVKSGEDYSAKVLKLYKAGILTGNDNFGTFAPDSNLLRSEICAMSVRIADGTKRVKKSFEVNTARTYSDAYSIIEVVNTIGRNGLPNAWNYDNRFEFTNFTGKDTHMLSDTSDKAFSRLIRDFDTEYGGVLGFETVVDCFTEDNGVYIAFENPDKERVLSLVPENGVWTLYGSSKLTTDIKVDSDKNTRYAIVMDIDLDNGKAFLSVNNKRCGSVDFDYSPLCRLVVGTEKETVGYISMMYARLYKGYAINEVFLSGSDAEIGQIPEAWEISGDFKIAKQTNSNGFDLYSAKSETAAGGISSAKRDFEAVSGKISFETMILLPEKTDGASVSLMCGETEAVKLETKNGGLYAGDTLVNDYIPNIWQTLHVEADTFTGAADIYINGKKKTTVSINAKYFDGVKVNFAPVKNACMWFDDVSVCNIVEHEDYPEKPVSVTDDGYNIGMNVCWLWRDQQSGEGWDAVSPFPEFEPYLGYYDEGLRETADHEIKQMVEHGIDFIHACWYSPSGPEISEPIKKMKNSHSALHDGYMMAKYSDMIDFCIMWENGNASVNSLEQFKSKIWNYWIEYFFKDERYLRLDNKALITIWSLENFIAAFGSESAAKEAVDFMNEDIKKYGYDGLLIWYAIREGTSDSVYKKLADIGIDATYGYHWGRNGYMGDYQIACNETSMKNASSVSHHIPTVSIGFNDVGRNYNRSPIVSVADHKKVCEYAKTALDSVNTGSWRDSTVMISTWNEFSEGTYIAPTASTGFDYLENVRTTITGDASVHNHAPLTDEQKDRISHLYPEKHTPVRWFQNEVSDEVLANSFEISDLVAVKSYDFSTAEGVSAFEPFFGITGYSEETGVISGSSAATDFAIRSNVNLGINADETEIVHIRMKNSVKANMEFFFTTEKDSGWGTNKKFKAVGISGVGEFYDYYIDMSDVASWEGNVNAIRFDPQVAAGSFEISLIEFMSKPKKDLSGVPVINVNGTDLAFTFFPKKTADGDFELVGEALKGFYSALRTYHEWDRFTDGGKLTILTRDDNEIIFTVGSDKVTVNGEEKSAGFTFTLRDGLPVFHMKKLCNLLGYPVKVEGNVVMVQAATDTEYNSLINKVANQWEFNIDGSLEGWTTGNCTAFVSDGMLCGKPTQTKVADPWLVHEVAFKAIDYTHVVMGMAYDSSAIGEKKAPPMLFYTTTESPNWSGDNYIKGTYNTEGLQDGDMMEVHFDLKAKESYAGDITRVRIDPFEAFADFKIDYIRFEYDPSVAMTAGLIECDDENQWYFDTDGDTEGWTFQGTDDGTAKNGSLTGKAISNDAAIYHAVNFDANDYQVVVIGLKYNSEFAKQTPELYFTTDSSSGWDWAKRVPSEYLISAQALNGDTVEVHFDMTKNAKWYGTVTNLRFDPFGLELPYEIDYIRLYKKKNYVPKEPPKPAEAVKATKPTTVVITDASEIPEGVTVTSAATGTVTVVDNPSGDGKVFKAECIKEGDQFVYVNIGMQFEAGKTYGVSYKLMPLKNMKGEDFSDTLIAGNFRFSTTENETVTDHVMDGHSNKSTSDTWIPVSYSFTVPENYSAKENDSFQIWGKFSGGAGINYLVDDIRIEY